MQLFPEVVSRTVSRLYPKTEYLVDGDDFTLRLIALLEDLKVEYHYEYFTKFITHFVVTARHSTVEKIDQWIESELLT